MDDKKYWVPAIERADKILNLIANHPGTYRLIDISKEVGINKSSLYSLLNTLEVLGWVTKEKDDTYSIGMKLGVISASYFRQFDLINTFNVNAVPSVERLEETIQLSVLNGKEIIYLAKKEGSSAMRIATEPGMKYPAHATAMGKVQLSSRTYEQLKELYPEEPLPPKTAYTITTVDELWQQILSIREKGYFVEYQEAVENFFCIAAPIRNSENEIIAAVSFTILEAKKEKKLQLALEEITKLADRISQEAGYAGSVHSV